MSGEIHIGQMQAVNAHVGDSQVIVGGSGTINNYTDPMAASAELKSALDELLRVITENGAGSAIQDSAELARAEANKPQPRTARLRELMNAVVKGAGTIGAVAQAALNVLGVINKLPL